MYICATPTDSPAVGVADSASVARAGIVAGLADFSTSPAVTGD